MKRKIFIAVCAFFLCVLTACSSTKTEGTWYLKKMTIDDGIVIPVPSFALPKCTMELYEDGTGVMYLEEDNNNNYFAIYEDASESLLWDQTSIKILSEGVSHPYTIEKNTLVIELDGGSLTFTKKK